MDIEICPFHHNDDMKNYIYTAPASLYRISINSISLKYKYLCQDFSLFPPDIHLDIIHGLYKNKKYYELWRELSVLENLIKILKSHKRQQLHTCFQAVMDFSLNLDFDKPSFIYVNEYQRRFMDLMCKKIPEALISEALNVSTFLIDSGWFEEAEAILLLIEASLMSSTDISDQIKLTECYQKLLHSQASFCKFKSAEVTYRRCLDLTFELQSSGARPNYALLYAQFASYFMAISDFSKAYNWALEAMAFVSEDLAASVIVSVLRHVSKACVLKREFKKAEILIKQVYMLSLQLWFNRDRLKMAEVLVDFGFYLLNVDIIEKSIKVYRRALLLRKIVLGERANNILLAMTHEDVAYASYVYQYSVGLFDEAHDNADLAIETMKNLLPKTHFLLSSCKRVKALILEEKAIERLDSETVKNWLNEAHDLHREALVSSIETFGEKNVQTAKHYGNLGRLYQSMKKFEEAEDFHLKSIKIKEELLGPNDYEVALSVGHLASLYNYDLALYDKAEQLYLRSIAIGLELFGEAYSGLEYDYRGLLRIYEQQNNVAEITRYESILTSWQLSRERAKFDEVRDFSKWLSPLGNLTEILREFNSSLNS